MASAMQHTPKKPETQPPGVEISIKMGLRADRQKQEQQVGIGEHHQQAFNDAHVIRLNNWFRKSQRHRFVIHHHRTAV